MASPRIWWSLTSGRLKYLRKAVKATLGERSRVCPLCGYGGPFINAGTPAVMDSTCPSCRSSPRQRLLKIADDKHQIVPHGRRILHFAAEKCLRPWIEAKNPSKYVTADLRGVGFDMKLNIEDIALESGSFDVIICSHVLEHVDDRKALAEMRRVLTPGGVLVAMVPIIEGWDDTYDDPSISDYEARKLHYGGGTHVRFYGRDFRTRLKAAGFDLTEYTGSPDETLKFGFIRGERIFVCRKPAG